MTGKEIIKGRVLAELDRGDITAGEAATRLERTERHIRRMLASYRQVGAESLAHGNRGRRSHLATDDITRARVLELARTKYYGFNQQHFTEKLNGPEGIQVSRSTVRRVLLANGLGSPRKRRAPQHRSRRERYPREGMLLQTDGSDHDWLEGRGPKLCLIGAIDDATNKVPYALFQESETTAGYMRMLKEIVLHYGIPGALYHDRHSIFEVPENKEPTIEEQLSGKEPITQMGRLLQELGITSIPANSPQAKGRIERLWGTFQDRLTSELRRVGAQTLEEANQVLAAFLTDYNRKFVVEAREPEVAYRKVEKGFQAEEYFCLKYPRTVGPDNVVRFGEVRLQVLPASGRSSYARCQVEVQQRLDGSLAVYYQGQPLPTEPAPPEPAVLRKPKLKEGVLTPSLSPKHYAKPSPDHPWRGIFRK